MSRERDFIIKENLSISYMHKGLDYEQVNNLTILERNLVIEQLNDLHKDKKTDKLINNGRVNEKSLGKIQTGA